MNHGDLRKQEIQEDYQTCLNTLEKAFRNGTIEHDQVRAFYNQAINSDRIVHARPIFDRLQTYFPSDREIRSLNIALCLQQKDYPTAMENIETIVATCTPDDRLIDAGLAVREKIGPMVITEDSVSNTVSLCMIVKNEMAGLGACLHGVKPLADEIIVVDTGSIDRTKDVAAIFGARTYDFTWSDDFSAARNFSLDQAQGNWILILDADEIIASNDHAALKKLIAEHCCNPKAFSIETRNYNHVANTIGWRANDGRYPQHEAGMGWVSSQKVRLFPNKKNIRFCHPVHEQVELAIKASDIPIVDCPVPVHHYGDLNENKKLKKARYYFKLGYDKLNQLGNDFQAIRELACQAGQLELWDESIELWERLLNISPNSVEAYVNLSGAYWHLSRYNKALILAEKAVEMEPDSREAAYNVAVSLLMLGKASKAADYLKLLVSKHPDFLPSQFMLMVCLACQNDTDGSNKILTGMLKTDAASALPAAVQDIVARFRQGGLNAYSEALSKIEEKYKKSSFHAGSDWNGKLKIGKNSSVSSNAIIEQPDKIHIGDNVQIKAGVVLRPENGHIHIGNNVVINHYCVIHAKGGVEIGDWTIMAPHCGIYAQNHSYESFDMPITKQPNLGRGITLVGDNWLGANSVILDGVTLGKGTVVGSGAIVTKSFPMAVIIAGNPAKIIKKRYKNDHWNFEKEERCDVEKTPQQYWAYIDNRSFFAERLLLKEDVVLDIGCGQGYITNKLKSKCNRIIGIDYSQEAVEIAKKRYGIEAYHASCDTMHFNKETFSKILFFEVMEHLTILQAQRAIAKIYQLLKPGGLLIGSTPIRKEKKSNPKTYSHIYEYSKSELTAMLKIFKHIEMTDHYFVCQK